MIHLIVISSGFIEFKSLLPHPWWKSFVLDIGATHRKGPHIIKWEVLSSRTVVIVIRVEIILCLQNIV